MKVSVRVSPKARREDFKKITDTEFTAAVRERPERNEANERVQVLLADHFSVPRTSVKFITGMRARKKVFEVVQ